MLENEFKLSDVVYKFINLIIVGILTFMSMINLGCSVELGMKKFCEQVLIFSIKSVLIRKYLGEQLKHFKNFELSPKSILYVNCEFIYALCYSSIIIFCFQQTLTK